MEKEAGHAYQVSIHDVYCEEERCILATASLCNNTTVVEPTSITIVTCKVEFFDVLSQRQAESEVSFSVVRNQRLERPIPSDAQDEIELHRVRCEVASTLGKANDLASAGKMAAAKEVLVCVQEKVKRTKIAARPLAVHLQNTVMHSLQGLEDTVSTLSHLPAPNYLHVFIDSLQGAWEGHHG